MYCNNISVTKLFIIVLWLFLPCSTGWAQMKQIDFHFVDPAQRYEKIPVKIVNNLVIIPLRINGSDTLNFVIDTGLRTTIITDLGVVNELNLQFGRQTTINGLGQGDPVEVIHSYNNTIDIKGVRGYYQNLFLLINAEFNLSTKLGFPVHGILGYDFFHRLIVEVDYTHKVMTIHNPDYYSYRKSAVWIPLEIQNYKPYIEANIELIDNEKIPIKLLIDLGASDAVWLFRNEEKKIAIPQKSLRTFLGRGLNGDINGYLCRINSFQIGKYSFKGVISAFPDTISISDSSVYETRDGSIGGEILRRFRVVIDYPNKRLTLRPNREYSDPFTYNVIGVEIYAPFPGLPYYEIAKIFEESPAISAGLREKDQVLSINYKSVYDMNISDINSMLRMNKSKKVRFKIMRDGEKRLIIVQTHDIL